MNARRATWPALESTFLFVLACLAGTIPLFLTTYPAMVDLPQHAAQVGILEALLRGESHFTDLLEFQWFTPYWLGYALIFGLAQICGIVLATKLTVASAVFAFPICADVFLRRHGGDRLWSYLFIPIGYGSALEWGFLNFILAVPIGFLWLSQVRVAESGYSKADFVRIAAWGHVLFFAHALALAFFWPIAALMQFHRTPAVWLRRLRPYFAVFPVVIAWALMRAAAKDSPAGAQLWNLGVDRLADLLPNLVALPASPYSQATALAVCAIPWAAGWRVVPTVNRLAPFAIYLVVMLAGPHIIFNISFVYDRFAYVGLPLYFFMFGSPTSPGTAMRITAGRIAGAAALAFAVVMVGYGSYRSVGYEEEARGYREIIAHAEPGRRLLNIVLDRRSDYYATPVYLHYPVWYQATHQGLVDFNFSWFAPQVVRYRPLRRPAVDGRFIFAPQQFNWQAHQGYIYDYFVIRYARDVAAQIFPPGAVRLVANSGNWWLYARAN